jgi:hypothetical protein
LLIRSSGIDQNKRRFDRCSLWLCVPQNPGRDDSNQWQAIQLGPIVTGFLN